MLFSSSQLTRSRSFGPAKMMSFFHTSKNCDFNTSTFRQRNVVIFGLEMHKCECNGTALERKRTAKGLHSVMRSKSWWCTCAALSCSECILDVSEWCQNEGARTSDRSALMLLAGTPVIREISLSMDRKSGWIFLVRKSGTHQAESSSST